MQSEISLDVNVNISDKSHSMSHRSTDQIVRNSEYSSFSANYLCENRRHQLITEFSEFYSRNASFRSKVCHLLKGLACFCIYFISCCLFVILVWLIALKIQGKEVFKEASKIFND